MSSELSTPVISVITPVYQSAQYIDETVASVLGQSFSDLELILVDDGSTDGSLERCQYWAERDSRVVVLKSPQNQGAAASRNQAMEAANGDYVAFLDSDDVWAPEKLNRQYQFMKEQACDFSFTAYQMENEAGESLGTVDTSQQQTAFSYQDMLKKQATLGCSTVMLKRSAIGSLRMPDIRTGQDYAFWLLLLKQGLLAYLLPEPLTRYRVRQGSISRNKVRKAQRQWQIYRRLERLGVFQSAWYFAFYAVRAVFRKQ